MKTYLSLRLAVAALLILPTIMAQSPDNPHVDAATFLRDANAAAIHRKDRVISQEKFLEMAAEKGTIVLDARSADKFAMLHVKGAINLPLRIFLKIRCQKFSPINRLVF